MSQEKDMDSLAPEVEAPRRKCVSFGEAELLWALSLSKPSGTISRQSCPHVV